MGSSVFLTARIVLALANLRKGPGVTTGHDEGQESLHSDLPSDFPLEPIDGRPLFDLDAWVETRTKGYRCWLCQRVSYHPEDERQQYCPCCGGPGLPKLCEHDPDGSKMMGMLARRDVSR